MSNFQRFTQNIPLPGRGAVFGVAFFVSAAGLSYGAYHSVFTVPGGHRAIMFSRWGGIQSRLIAEGTHFLIPWLNRPILYDIRTKPRNISSLTGLVFFGCQGLDTTTTRLVSFFQVSPFGQCIFLTLTLLAKCDCAYG